MQPWILYKHRRSLGLEPLSQKQGIYPADLLNEEGIGFVYMSGSHGFIIPSKVIYNSERHILTITKFKIHINKI